MDFDYPDFLRNTTVANYIEDIMLIINRKQDVFWIIKTKHARGWKISLISDAFRDSTVGPSSYPS